MKILATVIGGLLMGLGVAGAQGAPTAYQLKAAFLFNFLSFVEWPRSSLPEDGTFRLCVAEDDPFQGALARLLQDEKVKERIPVLTELDASADVTGCQVLFIPETVAPWRARRMLARTRASPTLTVVDDSQFLADGGIIGFHMDGARVRFDVNREASKESGLRVSSHLLKLATNVTGSAGDD